ncbi:MAG: hypothetical protein AAF698_05200 [Pseudomonadota bacterium]
MQPVIANARGVTHHQGFLRAEAGAITLDWVTITAASVMLTVAAVLVIGDEAMGLVDRMADEDAAHQRAVMEMTARQNARVAREPRVLYYPDSPEMAGQTPVMAGVSGVTIDRPRDAGGGGAFEPEIDEPVRTDHAGIAPAMPAELDADRVAEKETAGVVGVTGAVREACAEEAENPWVSESLRQTAQCD